ACTFICPTCHCFYLYDQAGGKEAFERVRTWDSCLLGDYHRMAGPAGAKPSPRPRLRTRFENRLLHKYAFSPAQYGMLGCTGCGRCIEACYGHIDIREVLREFGRDPSR
ncbi:MAG: 4Fe-4S dicluster domain-containing protein, partial [Planctomycetes bacterium]|nr:4Fe-4S dicluster domain-containing protein [Planctomycetota bacterium]